MKMLNNFFFFKPKCGQLVFEVHICMSPYSNDIVKNIQKNNFFINIKFIIIILNVLFLSQVHNTISIQHGYYLPNFYAIVIEKQNLIEINQLTTQDHEISCLATIFFETFLQDGEVRNN